MRITTYNIWNSDNNFYERLELLCNVLKECKGEIIALQEVRNEDAVNYIKEKCNFKYSIWRKFYDYEEGLAIFSNYPIIYSKTNWEENRNVHNSYVLRAVIDYNGINLGITNVHLDYKSVLNREIEILETIKLIEEYENEYEILLGDFNSYPESSVYRYLVGQQSLNNSATNWIDLAKSYAYLSGETPKLTLDFNNNPRWDNENSIEIPARFDWIMLKSPYPKNSPKLNCVDIIGDKREGNITPSDHYGVVCDINFENGQVSVLNPIKNLIEGKRVIENKIGESGDKVYKIVDFKQNQNAYLKVEDRQKSYGISREYEIYKFLKGKIKVPEVYYYKYPYLITSEIEGICSFHVREEEKLNAIRIIARELKTLHLVNVTGFNLLSELEWKIRNDRYSKEQLYNMHSDDYVLVHGDACLPNMIINGEQFGGFIDMGAAGVGNRYEDLAYCIWSILYNFKDIKYVDEFFQQYGNEYYDKDKLNFYIRLINPSNNQIQL